MCLWLQVTVKTAVYLPLPAERIVELTSDKAEIDKRELGGENGPSSRSVHGRNLH